MWQFRFTTVVLTALFPFFTVALAPAVTPNPKLLSLVPPAARTVAGMKAPSRQGQPKAVLLITHSNHVDLSDFVALVGADPSRTIEELIMVASDRGGIAFAEHGLMATGHFDQRLLYRSAGTAGAKSHQYHGIPVLEIPPFARERERFQDVRWLAMIDSKLALFGTIGIVQQELDRYLDHSGPDAVLVRRLAHLRRDDETWCVAKLPDEKGEMQSIFKILDSRLAEVLGASDTFQLGIHYGRQVEFEYEVGMADSDDSEAVQRALEQPFTERKQSSLLAAVDSIRIENGVHGSLKISKARYQTWITEVLASTALRAAESSNR